MDNKPIHLVVRFSDTMFGVGDVVARHNEIVKKHDSVWFGKMGQSIAQKRIDMLNKQEGKSIPTFLYLVKGNRKKSTLYRAKLMMVSREMPKEGVLIPPYYVEKGILQYIKVWMKIQQIEPIELSEMNGLKAFNSVLSFPETLALSQSGYFLVKERKL